MYTTSPFEHKYSQQAIDIAISQRAKSIARTLVSIEGDRAEEVVYLSCSRDSKELLLDAIKAYRKNQAQNLWNRYGLVKN